MNSIVALFFRVPAILLAITVHELAHGWTARKLGDTTAERMGRLTLNPLAHLDFFGTLMLLFGPFGWAKPVPVNPANLQNPKRDMIWVSVAGPLSNILLGYITAMVYRFVFHGQVHGFSKIFFIYFIIINIGLSFFNLLPIPPLDGSNIVRGFMPYQTEVKYLRAMRRVPVIFLVMIGFEWILNVPVLSFILNPLWKPYLNLMLDIYGVKSMLFGG